MLGRRVVPVAVALMQRVAEGRAKGRQAVNCHREVAVEFAEEESTGPEDSCHYLTTTFNRGE